jgi:hypothetical protein
MEASIKRAFAKDLRKIPKRSTRGFCEIEVEPIRAGQSHLHHLIGMSVFSKNGHSLLNREKSGSRIGRPLKGRFETELHEDPDIRQRQA